MNTSSLTKNQELLWIGQQLSPTSPMYNMVMTYEIFDTISVEHFKLAFQKLVDKSDALRSVFLTQNGITTQNYNRQVNAHVNFIDFSAEKDPNNSYNEWQTERVTISFDLTNTLFDCALIQLASDHFIWYINCHHLITDGTSSALMLEEMSLLYEEAQNGIVDTSRNLPLYSGFSSFEKSRQSTTAFENAKNYWNEKRNEFPKAPSLYFKDATSLQTTSVRKEIFLGKERTEKLVALANEKGIRSWTLDLSLYNIFLTTLFAFMYRVSGQSKLLIGAPTHNRTTSDFKKTIGFFVEVFPVLAELEKEETFISLLKKVQIASNHFLKYAQTGTSSADINRDFNVFFNYILNTKITDFNGAPTKTSWVHPAHSDPRHHIRFHVHDFDNTGEIKLYVDLNTGIFNDEECERVPLHFINLIDAFIANKEQAIDTTSFVTKEESEKIFKWNDTATDFDHKETLLTKFLSQVEKTPDAVALKFQDKTLTYQEFDKKSNQVAHWLIKKGIEPNDVVIVSMERSLEMMIYIYGVLKSGAIYLPVDTATPKERLQFILEDVKAKILVYNHRKIETSVAKNPLCYDICSISQEIEQHVITTPKTRVKQEDIAYIIYTSGSTGAPKGVKCHHKGICNRLNWMRSDYPISHKDIFIQKTPVSFDVSLWELFLPLQIGATLVVEVPDGHKDPERLIKTIKENNVSIIHFVPSMLAIFIQNKHIVDCTSLNHLFCSGEALSASIVKKAYEKLDVEIYNFYGPTEAAIEVARWHCDKSLISDGIPIGQPVPNTQLYILDKKNNMLPIGIPGELHIAGVQVANGYVNRNQLTKNLFIKDVFSKSPEAIMYKTGDLARYRENGDIEYLGRIDHQLKIRGQRIELGEIEKNIEKYEGVSQSIVIVDDHDNLIAFYAGNTVSENDLISFLAVKLPSYMIPSHFIKLDSFEYLPTGKVNRKKLAASIPRKNTFDKNYLEPENEIEELILEIWKEVLAIDYLGVDENFIRIGGNSLHAISITSRLKHALELELSITDIFNYPTIIKYAAYVEDIINKLLNEKID